MVCQCIHASDLQIIPVANGVTNSNNDCDRKTHLTEGHDIKVARNCYWSFTCAR